MDIGIPLYLTLFLVSKSQTDWLQIRRTRVAASHGPLEGRLELVPGVGTGHSRGAD